MAVADQVERSLRDRVRVREAPILVASGRKADFAEAGEAILAKLLQPGDIVAWRGFFEPAETFRVSQNCLCRACHSIILSKFPGLKPWAAESPFRGVETPRFHLTKPGQSLMRRRPLPLRTSRNLCLRVPAQARVRRSERCAPRPARERDPGRCNSSSR